ncbi:MAG: hypothetical protein Q4B17_14715, partial [Lautropia sp.]|nr:hypothetical protein [Lautropia sp.]
SGRSRSSESAVTFAGIRNYYDEQRKPLEGSPTLAGLDSLAARRQKARDSLPDNDPVPPASVIVLKPGQH